MIDIEGRRKDLSIGCRSRTAARSDGCGHSHCWWPVPGGVKKGRPYCSYSWTIEVASAASRSLEGATSGPVKTASLGTRVAGVREQESPCEP